MCVIIFERETGREMQVVPDRQRMKWTEKVFIKKASMVLGVCVLCVFVCVCACVVYVYMCLCVCNYF